jgi:predicted O-linked N-acetylglucosamine transferase (SPINDLY family)
MARAGGAIGAIRDIIKRGEYGRAEDALKKALAVLPRDAELLHAMGFVLVAQEKYAQAEYFMRRAVELSPTASALHNLGSLLMTLGKLGEAEGVMRRGLEVAPRDGAMRGSLAKVLFRQSRFGAARVVLEEGRRVGGEDAELLSALAHSLHQVGRVEEALVLMKKAAGIEPRLSKHWDLLCSMMTYAPGVEAREVFEAHVEYGRVLAGEVGKRARPAMRGRAGRALRVGLISGDLRRHAVASFIEPVLERADRARLTLHCYYTGAAEDGVSARLKGLADGWRHVAALSPDGLAAAVRGDEIDVLVDLAGHTAGNRLAVFAMRPAPVQVSYLGYANTTGVAAVDARIVDSVTDPAGSEGLATERLLRVDPSFLCYRGGAGAPAARAKSGPFTFASFASSQKLSSWLLGVWASLLREVPGSRLVLKSFAFAEEATRREVAERMAALGVEASRVEVRAAVASLDEHLASYGGVDLSLDTMPYNGTTTILESLSMGVPVVTMRGRAHAGRVAESILRVVGLGELVAEDEEGYVRLAAALAGDPARLERMRAELPGRVRASALCDEGAFVARWCAAIEEAWDLVAAGE